MHASEQAADGIAPQEKREKSGERWPLKSLLEYHLRLREHLDGLIQVVNLRLQLLLRLSSGLSRNVGTGPGLRKDAA